MVRYWRHKGYTLGPTHSRCARRITLTNRPITWCALFRLIFDENLSHSLTRNSISGHKTSPDPADLFRRYVMKFFLPFQYEYTDGWLESTSCQHRHKSTSKNDPLKMVSVRILYGGLKKMHVPVCKGTANTFNLISWFYTKTISTENSCASFEDIIINAVIASHKNRITIVNLGTTHSTLAIINPHDKPFI